MSRYTARFVSAILLLGMIGGVGIHSFAANSEDVQPVRRQFSTAEELTSIRIAENNASVTIRSGEDDQTYVSYADTSEEILYDIYVEDGTLVVDKLKENPRTPTVTVNGKVAYFSSEEPYRLEVVVPQKQYESITITNASAGCAELDSVSSKDISVQLKTGFARLSQTKSNHINTETDTGYIALDNTDSLQYDLKVETGKITGNVLGRDGDYSIEPSVARGISNLKSRHISASSNFMKLSVGTGLIEIDFSDDANR